ncbi:MAG: hypothetical protein R3F30_04360 [Planctomycetota bacterium]
MFQVLARDYVEAALRGLAGRGALGLRPPPCWHDWLYPFAGQRVWKRRAVDAAAPGR